MTNLENLSYDILWDLRDKASISGDYKRFGRICEIIGKPEDPTTLDNILLERYSLEKKDIAGLQKKIDIPGRTEIPYTVKGYQRWIRDFVKMNEDKGIRLPKDFGKKSEKQLRGMFYRMLKYYKISEEDISPKKY